MFGRPRPQDTLTEFVKAGVEIAALNTFWPNLKRMAPRGDGSPVLIMPGFMANDITTYYTRQFLRELNYKVYPWENGINLGPNPQTLKAIDQRLDDVHRQTGKPVILIGHSLGGVYARELARAFPKKVKQVITLGSPFGAGKDKSMAMVGLRAWFNYLNPNSPFISDEKLAEQSLQHPPVPTTSIYTSTDGIVNWRTCIGPRCELAEHVEVAASHIALVANPMALLVVADRAAQNPKNWKPFNRAHYPDFLFRNHQAHDRHGIHHPVKQHAPVKVFG